MPESILPLADNAKNTNNTNNTKKNAGIANTRIMDDFD